MILRMLANTIALTHLCRWLLDDELRVSRPTPLSLRRFRVRAAVHVALLTRVLLIVRCSVLTTLSQYCQFSQLPLCVLWQSLSLLFAEHHLSVSTWAEATKCRY